MHPPLGTSKRPPELVCRTEPATGACNCMGSQQLCHSCSRLLPANENDYADSLECASTTGDLQKAPRTCLHDRASHCSMQLHGQPTALSQLFSFTGSKREQLCTLLRVCIQNFPDVASTIDIASATPSTHSQERAGPGRYQSSHLLLLLPMSDDNNACPMGHASNTGDTQVVPRISQAPHKLCLPKT